MTRREALRAALRGFWPWAGTGGPPEANGDEYDRSNQSWEAR